MVHWKSTPGKHPTVGRTGFQVIVTDKRVIFGKSGVLARLGQGMAIGGAMSAVTGGVAQAAAGAAVSGLGSALSFASYASLDDKRNVASADLDALLAQNQKLTQISNQSISQVRLKKGGLLGTDRVFFHVPEGVFELEGGGFKDLMKAFQVIFPGRVIAT